MISEYGFQKLRFVIFLNEIIRFSKSIHIFAQKRSERSTWSTRSARRLYKR